jgi:hypothetical protein
VTGRPIADPQERASRAGWDRGVRQVHRWVSALFVLAVVATTVVAATAGDGAGWAYYLPLLPLLVLTLTGLNLFVLPWLRRRRPARTAG